MYTMLSLVSTKEKKRKVGSFRGIPNKLILI